MMKIVSDKLRKFSLDNILNTTIVSVLLIVSVYFFAVDVYMLNKGFSIWDEGYYLQSYQMAYQGYFAHFNNTPFVVAKLFEWAHPGIVGYRLIHLVLNITGYCLFTLAIVRQLETLWIKAGSLTKWMPFAVAIYAAQYSFQLSVTTLSYNHLNEFFLLMSQAALLFALQTNTFNKNTILLLVMSGAFAAFTAYIKPPTFILLVTIDVIVVAIYLVKEEVGKYLAIYFVGLIGAILLSLVWIMTPAEWLVYFEFIGAHKTHSPMEVVTSFIESGWTMLSLSGSLILWSVTAIWLSINRGKWLNRSKAVYFVYLALILVAYVRCAREFYLILLPKEIWTSFQLHWWYLLTYSATFLLAATIISTVGAVLTYRTLAKDYKGKFYLMVSVLILNPIICSIGTANGFGQVQIHLVSWMLLICMSSLIVARGNVVEIKIYAAMIFISCVLVAAMYFYRQILPGNFSDQGTLSEQKYQIQSKGPLGGIYVNKPTFELYENLSALLDKYPRAATLVFFDAPGLQYALGREWVVPDPWLTNFDQPRTKDDEYNCRVLTKNISKVNGAIFIVARQKEISSTLKECLIKIGYPDQLALIGSITTTVGSMTEPIYIYLHP